jgi:hypothetical protein
MVGPATGWIQVKTDAALALFADSKISRHLIKSGLSLNSVHYYQYRIIHDRQTFLSRQNN